jgi:hypothetical protein
MERRSINPVPWSLKLGFDQAVLIEGPQRQLVCGGQDSVDPDGNRRIRATWPRNSSYRSTPRRLSWPPPT